MIRIFGLKKKKVTTLGLGVFDGIHRGHQIIADKCDALLTLFPHPDWFLGKNKGLKMLSTLREQRVYFNKLLVLHFTKAMARLDHFEFLEEIVYRRINPKEIVVGSDFRFGYKAKGDINVLAEWTKKRNIQLTVISEYCQSGIPIKSSYIRQLFNEDKFTTALDFLGHSYLIIGEVIKGEGRGKKIGFPTSNLKVPSFKLIPQEGVYEGEALFKKQTFPCLIYIGRKPTFNYKELVIEVYIHNFQKQIYKRQLKVFIKSKIRKEMVFANEKDLIAQIKEDLNCLIIKE